VKLPYAAALLVALPMMAVWNTASCQQAAIGQKATETDMHAGPLRPPGMAERAWLARQEATRTRVVALVMSAVALTLFCTLWLRFRRRQIRRLETSAGGHRARDGRSNLESGNPIAGTEP
jgi:hypothetical protein